MAELWCYIEGKRNIFKVSISPDRHIDHLRNEIYNMAFRSFPECDAMDLALTKVDVNYNGETKEKVNDGQYRPAPNDQLLDARDIISDIWERPRDDQLHIFVSPPGGVGNPSGPFNWPDSTPFLSQSLSPHASDTYLRSNTVSALYKRLKRYSFILVRGTPASGKTTLARLLAEHIRQQEPVVHVVGVCSWPLEEVKKAGGWQAYLLNLGWIQGRTTVFIFDEAQTSYGDTALWGEFFKNIADYSNLFAIIFASYGSPTSRLGLPSTPFVVRDSQRVTLRPVNHTDGLDAVGLLFSRMEFNDFVRERFASSYFHPSFFDAVFKLTGGHAGAIYDFVEIVIGHDSYRLLKNTPGQLYTWDLFLAEVSPRDLLDLLETSACIIKRGLPLKNDLEEAHIARVFSHVLCRGSIVQSDLTTKEDVAALEECFYSGWLHADKLSDIHDDEETAYIFPSELHRWFVEWRLFHSVPTAPFRSNTILELALEVIGRFSPHFLSAERRIGPGCIQRPPEAKYQDEFYRSCHAYSNGSLITFPEFGTLKGRADFYIPSKQWGVELLCEGEQHSGRFSRSGSYGTYLPLSDYIILDCHNIRPTHPHPNIPKLYHIIFSNDYQDISVLDHLLRPVHGGEIRLWHSV